MNEDRVLEVHAPVFCSREMIERVVSGNRLLIDRLFARSEQIRQSRPELKDGTLLWYLGETYPLWTANSVKLFDGEQFLVPAGSPDQRLEALEQIYRSLAGLYIIPRAEYLAGKYGIPVKRIRINGARTRWGSCSADGCINFSWRLIRVEKTLIDAVICHELAHRKVMDHSPAFYACLENMCPGYAGFSRQLKAFSRRNPYFN